MRPKPRLLAASLILASATAYLPDAFADSADPLCVDCLSLRLGPPVVVRGPFPDELDNHFAAVRLKDGSFRGFSANGASYAVDGPDLKAMSGQRRTIMEPGPKGSATDCGRWLNGVLSTDGELYGLVHQESGCDYDNGQTHKSMALAVSKDHGLSWTNLGTIISGRDAPKAGTITGEGDCTFVDGHDGYLYAYCLRNSDWKTIAARAPLSNPAPGEWRKFHDGRWNRPGLGGAADAIGFFGTASGYLEDLGRVALITEDPWFGGLRLALSKDKAHFENLKDPLLPIDGSDWNRPAPTDLIAYVSILNPEDGTNTVGSDFLIAYVYLPPGATFGDRHLVLQEVHIELGKKPVAVQAGTALSRWKDAKSGIYRTSTGPVTDSAFGHEKTLGYLMTREPDGASSVKLEECVGGPREHADHLVMTDGSCAKQGYSHLRTSGWAYDVARPDTVPLYRCHDERVRTHFLSNAPDCEGLGTMEFVLGYALER